MVWSSPCVHETRSGFSLTSLASFGSRVWLPAAARRADGGSAKLLPPPPPPCSLPEMGTDFSGGISAAAAAAASPALYSLSLFHRLRTASSERPGSIAAIFLHRQPTRSTLERMISSSAGVHSLRSAPLRAGLPAGAMWGVMAKVAEGIFGSGSCIIGSTSVLTHIGSTSVLTRTSLLKAPLPQSCSCRGKLDAAAAGVNPNPAGLGGVTPASGCSIKLPSSSSGTENACCSLTASWSSERSSRASIDAAPPSSA
mmetsp:Transcript_726/g.1500  ORF Transcript_726/g.1500 Transcript_726/m.1500 type:complete len:255 (+) Transcript_726:855-1619(+)